MGEKQPSKAEWKALFEAFLAVRDLEPWKYLYDMDIFGVQDPESGDIGYVTVLGAGGREYAVHVYRGDEGFSGLMRIAELGARATRSYQMFEAFVELDFLNATWSDRSTLSTKDLKLIKSLGYRFRGRKAWPLFRSHIPGHVPWYLTAPEARYLTLVLEQLIQVLEEHKNDLEAIRPTANFEMMVRVPVKKPSGSLTWKEERVGPPETTLGFQVVVQPEVLEHMSAFRTSRRILELDSYPLEQGVQPGRGERPYYPYLSVLADAVSGLILFTEVADPIPTLTQARYKAALVLIWHIIEAEEIPQKVRVRHPEMAFMLQELGEKLGFEIEEVDRLPRISTFRKKTSQTFRRGKLH